MHSCLRPSISVLLALVVVCAGAPELHARGRDEAKEAKRHYRAGEKHYKLGQFEQALERFTKAYEAKSLPGFLFNIAQCHMELRDFDRAIFFYEGYLREELSRENRELAEARLQEARERLAEQREREEREAATPVAPAPAPAPLSAEATSPTSEPPAEVSVAESSGGAFYQRWWFWTIVGAVVAGTATAAALGVFESEKKVLPSGELETFDARGP